MSAKAAERRQRIVGISAFLLHLCGEFSNGEIHLFRSVVFLWNNSSQQRLGEAMGYPAPSARKSVSQFLRSHDPSISVLRRFAKAAGVTLGQLVGD